jgi:hypothetical protein
MEIRICQYFALAAAALGLPAIAAAQSSVGGGDRIILSTGVHCRAAPDGAVSATRLHAGDVIWKPAVRFGPPVWYFDATRGEPGSAGCWIPGDATAPFDGRHPEIGYAAVVDHLLSRRDTAPFAEYVEVQNVLEAVPLYQSDGTLSLIDRFPLVRYRSLQLINRAVRSVRWHNNPDAPLTQAWIFAHRNVLEYGESAASWQVTSRAYWDIFDKHPNEPWSEDLAWVAGQYSSFGDECDADCYLGMITEGPQQYWTRLPHGAHVTQALAKADEIASAAIKDGVGEGAPTLPAIESVRKSLSAVTAPGKVHLLALLAELQQKVKPRRP